MPPHTPPHPTPHTRCWPACTHLTAGAAAVCGRRSRWEEAHDVAAAAAAAAASAAAAR
jgi:hypothetical protein